MLFRRAFTALSLVWAAAIPVAALAASRPDAARASYAFALAVYSIGSAICHQLPQRSFHLWGAALPVCARCTGIYAGAALTAVCGACSSLGGRSPGSGPRAHRSRVRVPVTLGLAVLPTLITLAYEWWTGVMPGNPIRAVAGAPIGAAVAWIVIN